jgi:hypothetical protein
VVERVPPRAVLWVISIGVGVDADVGVCVGAGDGVILAEGMEVRVARCLGQRDLKIYCRALSLAGLFDRLKL